MIKKLKVLDEISHHFYKSQTLSIIQKYNIKTSLNNFNPINFNVAAQPQSIIRTIFNPKKFTQLFQLYLKFICRTNQNKSSPEFQWIEQNLRRKIDSQLKKQNLKFEINKFQVLSSQELERRSFQGVFIHRKYNLNIDSYTVNCTTASHTNYQIKKNLRSQTIREFEKIIRSFKEDGMQQLYGKKFDKILTQTRVTRYLYRLKTNLQIKKIPKRDQSQIFGNKGPTEHLLQIQSFFHPISHMEQIFLTDVDFVLQGNHFLKKKI